MKYMPGLSEGMPRWSIYRVLQRSGHWTNCYFFVQLVKCVPISGQFARRKRFSRFSRAYNFTIRPRVVKIHLTNVYNINFVHQARLNYKKKQLLNRFLVWRFSIN